MARTSSAPTQVESRGGRPFWLHQLAEYLLGGLTVAQGVRSPTPVLPAIAGALVLVNAACARGPLAAFRVFTRAQHRVADVVVMLAMLVAAAQPFVHVDGIARLVLGGVALALFVVWSNTNFAERPRRRERISAADGRSVEIGRIAGRAVGDGVSFARRVRDSRKR
jgi:hypothetical protein